LDTSTLASSLLVALAGQSTVQTVVMVTVRVTVAVCLGFCIGYNQLFLGLMFHIAFNFTHTRCWRHLAGIFKAIDPCFRMRLEENSH
jgi:hypothetical protein